MATVTKEQVLAALREVKDPDLGRDIVSLDFVKEVKICDATVGVTIQLTTPACPVKEELRKDAETRVLALPGVERAEIKMTARTVGRSQMPEDILQGVKNVVAVASGKGGVGKSTAAVNLALALVQTGAQVGILDADIYGPSIPGMLGLREPPVADAQGKAVPPAAFGIKAMSVGMLIGDDAPAIWRGPIASRMLQQFLGAVNWGPLDYLLLDLPPGTGDVQLTLTQSAPINGAVIVTTPQDVALRIARKGLKMFQQVNVPVLGIIENMSGFVCPSCQAHHDIFSSGGGERTAREMGVPFLGRIPIDPRIVEACDAGTPLIALDKDSPAAQAFVAVAKNVASQLSISNINESQVKDRPKEVHLVDQTPPKIVWSDGSVMRYEHRALRLACPCASCRGEMTGDKILKDEDVLQDIRVVETRPVGRYGLCLVFSDNHATGIYDFNMLRELGTTV